MSEGTRDRWERAPEVRRLRFTLGELEGPHNAIALQADLQITFEAGQWTCAAEECAGHGVTLVHAVLDWLTVRLGLEPPAAGEEGR
jgi:hypothetical protein